MEKEVLPPQATDIHKPIVKKKKEFSPLYNSIIEDYLLLKTNLMQVKASRHLGVMMPFNGYSEEPCKKSKWWQNIFIV